MMKRIIVAILLMMGMVSVSLADIQKLAAHPLVRWSPDGQWIATVTFEGVVSIASLSTPSQTIELKHEGSISDVAWDASSGRLATATHADGTIRIWDAKTGSLLSAFQSEATRDGTIILSWNSKREILATLTWVGDGGLPIRFWDTNDYVLIGTTVGVDAEVIGWSPDGTKLAISGYIHGVRIYDTFVGNPIPFKTQGLNALRLAWSPDSTKIVALTFYIQARSDGIGSWNLYTWSTIIDANTLQELDQITQPTLNNLYKYPTLWSPDEERIVILYANHINVIDAQTGSFLNRILVESPNYDAAWSPFGGRLAIVGASAANAPTSNIPGLQFVVPAPSLDLINNIESACVPAEVIAQLPDAEIEINAYIDAVTQNEAIMPGCAADLVAVAEALEESVPDKSTQTDIDSFCHPLSTKYDQILSQWEWQDRDTVVFSVSPGYSAATDPIVWYEYHPSTDELIELNSNPYEDIEGVTLPSSLLNAVQRDEQGTFEDVFISPAGDRLVYPQIDLKTGKKDYWYTNLQTGVKLNLKLEESRSPLMVFWATNSGRFLIQGDFAPNSIVPTVLVSIEDERVTTQRLTELPPLSTRGIAFDASYFRVKGLSPDGKLILIQPETSEITSWVFVVDENRISPLAFDFFGDRAIWLDENTIVAITRFGIVEYDIEQQRLDVRLASTELYPFAQSLSPDGRFFMGKRLIREGSSESEILSCRVDEAS